MKFIAPNNEDTPAKCNEKIAKSTDPPECDCILDNGGYHNLISTTKFCKYYVVLLLRKDCVFTQDRTIPLPLQVFH